MRLAHLIGHRARGHPWPTPRRRCVPLQGSRRVSGVSRGSILSFNRRPPPLAAMDQRLIAAAREYVERSNCGDVDACLAMFSNDAVYGRYGSICSSLTIRAQPMNKFVIQRHRLET